MKRTLNTVLFVALITAQLIGPSAFAACTQGGQCQAFGCTLMQYLYNIDFSETCSPVVWTKNNGAAATIVKSGGTAMCGGFFQSYVQMNGNSGNYSKVVQTVTIPAGETRTHWTGGWNISTDDPHNDVADQMYVQFYDKTTLSILGTSPMYYGNGVDPNCRLDTLSLGTHNLAGHQIEVSIVALIDPTYTDTHFYVTNVQLDGTF